MSTPRYRYPDQPPRSRIERGSGDPLVDLLSADPAVRELACEAVELEPDPEAPDVVTSVGLFALRRALLLDTHAPVRRAAAERFARVRGEAERARVVPWLIEALGDRFPSVREAVCRALAAVAEAGPATIDQPAPQQALARRLVEDPIWWVRRAAARSLAAVLSARPDDAIEALLPGLHDPFWRVRHGVVHAMAVVLGKLEEPALDRARVRLLRYGESVRDEGARAALLYLARDWPIGEDVPALAGAVGDPAGIELDDPDPAVVTARLQRAEHSDPATLIRLLAESHEPLRREAMQRLAKLRDPDALLPGLAWLEDPRVPHAPAAAAKLLERLGARARRLAEQALDSGRPGALVWAARWVAVHPSEALHGRLLEHRSHAQRRVRVAIAETCGVLLGRGDRQVSAFAEVLRQLLQDDELDVRDAAAAGLLRGASFEALTDERLATISPAWRARALQRIALARAGEPARFRSWLHDPDGRVRASAIMGLLLAGELTDDERERCSCDDDPLVRQALIDLSNADPGLIGDPDPGVRRRCARLLVRRRRTLDVDRRHGLARAGQGSADAWVRATLLGLIEPSEASEQELTCLLLATREREAMVRAAAADRLAAIPELGVRLDALLERTTDTELRLAAWTHRLLAPVGGVDPSHAPALLESARAGELDERVREHLDAIAVAFGAAAPEPRPRAAAVLERRAPAPPPAVERRRLGDSGIELAPLVISGAYGLMPGSLAHAVERGVDTCFWEPRYTNLTSFLRQRSRASVQVIAGSFHADHQGLEADLELARHRLRRDTIDLFLLFWVRSPARLGAEALAALREFQARGWIRSYGFSTHDRALACEAIATGDWPVIMTRHSAAHPGAEDELLPMAAAAGVGVLGFSALCYGRMLRESSVFERGPEALDCYRYSLAQPGLAACISAPRRHRELVENLGVLDSPALDRDHIEALRAHGREVHADNKRFDRLMRRGGSAPLREALLELFDRATEPDDAASEARGSE